MGIDKKTKTKISKSQAIDTGMALVLIFILANLFLENDIYIKIALVLLVMNMIVPTIFKPAAIVWFGFSRIAGTVMSKVLLTIVYFVVLFPVGIFRRMIGKDALQLKKFKKDNKSVFINRDSQITDKDILYPY